MKDNKGVGLFVMPRSSSAWEGSEALWITAGGWAAAAEEELGKAFILTTDEIVSPRDVLSFPREKKQIKKSTRSRIMGRFLPKVAITFIKDILLFRKSISKANYNYEIPFSSEDIAFVWEQHDFFPGIGYQLAQEHKVPYIVYVHAPQVWESQKWGVKRPIWGNFLERIESGSLKKADVVACVSPQVAEKVEKMGVPSEKILLSPMAVDPVLFQNVEISHVLEEYDLKNKFIIGWTGSFRSFHGLDLLLKIFKRVHKSVDHARLVLVGDGFERKNIQRLSRELGLEDLVIFTGRKSFVEIPSFVKSFDLAIVSAGKANEFHYSPLKLREYLGAGTATLAPNAGEIPDTFRDNYHLKLYEIGDIEGTAKKITDLYFDNEKRSLMAEKGREFINANGTWKVELDKLLNRIQD